VISPIPSWAVYVPDDFDTDDALSDQRFYGLVIRLLSGADLIERLQLPRC